MSSPSEEVLRLALRIIQIYRNAVRELVVQVREDVPEDQATRHLWEHVEYCESLLDDEDNGEHT